MNYKKMGVGLAVFAIVALAGSTIVSAATPDNSLKGSDNKMNNEHKLEINTAIESGDYQTFKSLTNENSKMFKVITEDNFAQFVTMHNLMKAGNFTEAKVIAQELGLGMGRGMFGEGGRHNGQGPNSVDSNGDGLCNNADVK